MQKRRLVVATVGPPGRPGPPSRPNRTTLPRVLLSVVVAGLVIAADQLTKTWAVNSLTFDIPRHVVGSLSWDLTINRGAAFSLGTGVTPILEVVAVVLVTVLAVAAQRAGRSSSLLVIVALGLLLGGALSNLGDRLFRSYHGGVVDFVDALRFGDHDRWPIFNLADSSITIGAILMVIAGTRQRSASPPGGDAGPGGRHPAPDAVDAE